MVTPLPNCLQKSLHRDLARPVIGKGRQRVVLAHRKGSRVAVDGASRRDEDQMHVIVFLQDVEETQGGPEVQFRFPHRLGGRSSRRAVRGQVKDRPAFGQEGVQQLRVVQGAGVQNRIRAEPHGHGTPCDQVNPVTGLHQARRQRLPDKPRAADEQSVFFHLLSYLTTAR